MIVDRWNPAAKFGAVAAGYALAAALASAAVAFRIATTSGPEAVASSGMHAFGDAMVGIGVFGLCSLAPTALALSLLRRSRAFWIGWSTLGALVALTGVVALVAYLAGRTADPRTAFGALAMASPLRLLLALPVTLSLLVSSLLAPFPFARLALRIATLAELVVGCSIAVVWFVPLVLSR